MTNQSNNVSKEAKLEAIKVLNELENKIAAWEYPSTEPEEEYKDGVNNGLRYSLEELSKIRRRYL